jgi:uncharacterized protein
MTNSKFTNIAFDKDAIAAEAALEGKLGNWPVVYTILGSHKVYVGETTNFEMRMRQHIDSGSKSDLSAVTVVLNDSFNKSACLDLESQLIKFLFADNQFKVLNGNSGIVNSDYFDRSAYQEEFDKIFAKLVEEKVLTRSINELINTDFFKYSPFKSLNTDQALAVQHILETIVTLRSSRSNPPFVIEGSPGTGKTIVAIYLMKLLADIRDGNAVDVIDGESVFSELFIGENKSVLSKLQRVALVIPQQSLRTSLKKVFEKTPGLEKKMVLSAFELAEAPEPFDLVIVDEAHRLQRRANQSSAMLNKKFTSANIALFGTDDKSKTQLDWVFKQSKQTILLVDGLQAVKPADIPLATIESLKATADANKTYFGLTNQMRVEGGNAYVDFVDDLLHGRALDPKRDYGTYRLEVFDSVTAMREEILRLDSQAGLSRLLAGYAWPWLSKSNPKQHDIEIDGLKLFWNRTAQDWINSATSVEEVGSIHTVQGYDLNYAGVIIGPDVSYDASARRIVFNRENYFDAKGQENNPTLGLTFSDEDIREYVLNIYRVLLTRGIKGTFVHAVDPALQDYLRAAVG